jgi:hypothetical protein
MSSNHLETYRSDQVGVRYTTIAIESDEPTRLESTDKYVWRNILM